MIVGDGGDFLYQPNYAEAQESANTTCSIFKMAEKGAAALSSSSKGEPEKKTDEKKGLVVDFTNRAT